MFTKHKHKCSVLAEREWPHYEIVWDDGHTPGLPVTAGAWWLDALAENIAVPIQYCPACGEKLKRPDG